MSQIGKTTRTGRALMEVLRPLTGDPSTGSATIKSTSGDVKLPKRCFMAPLRRFVSNQEALDRDNLLRTREDVIATTAGVSVPLISMLGGKRQNHPVGTRLLLDPPLLGIEPYATVDTGGMTGGADASGTGSVRQIVRYEIISSATAAKDLFSARVHAGAPAIVVAWNDSGSPTAAGRAAVRPDQWIIYVVTSRNDGKGVRGDDGADILDAVESYLHDRHSVAGHVFSQPSTQILSRGRLTTTPTSYIYTLTCQTTGAVKRIDTRGELTFAEWKRTLLDLPTADVPPFPIVDQVGITMLLGSFDDDAFDSSFETSAVIDG